MTGSGSGTGGNAAHGSSGGAGARANSASAGSGTSTTGRGGNSGGSSSKTSGMMRAKVDGTAWEATTVRSRLDPKVPGGYTLDGILSQATSQISLSLYYVGTTGDYTIGVDASVVGAHAAYTTGTMAFQSPSNGAAGKLAVKELTPEHIAGTFEFSVIPVAGSTASGTHAITEGEFDIDLSGAAQPIAANVGRSLSATFNGTRFNAATVILNKLAGGVSFNALNDDYNVGFYFAGVDAAGTYDLSLTPPARTLAIVMGTRGDPKTHCCWGPMMSDSGSLTLTTLSADRLVGTFEFAIQPQTTGNGGATSPLSAMEGKFDIGRAEP